MTISPEYARYLESPEWQRTRRLALKYYGYRCAVCGTTLRLRVHHCVYRDQQGSILGRERMDQLSVLCKDHHPKGAFGQDVIREWRNSLIFMGVIVWIVKAPFRFIWFIVKRIIRAVSSS